MSLRKLRRRLLWVAVLTVVIAVGLWGWKAPSGPPPRSFGMYGSSGSLMSPYDRNRQAGVLGQALSHTQLDFWLSDPALFARMMDREGIYDTLEKALKKSDPELAAQARSVMVTPNYQEAIFDAKGAIKQKVQTRTDYATLQQQVRRNQGIGFVRSQRPTRIVIQASATSPKAAERLARVGMQVVRSELARIAVQEVRARRRVVEQYIRTTERKVARVEQRLTKKGRLDAAAVNVNERRMRELAGDVVRLRSELRQAEASAQRVVAPDEKGPVVGALGEAERKRLAWQQIYQPDSSAMRALDERIGWLRLQAQRIAGAAAEQAALDVRASIQSKRVSLEASQAELAELSRKQASQAQIMEFRSQERELAVWNAELLQWQRKWIELRLQERLCVGEGSWLPLQTPQPGSLTSEPVRQFLQPYEAFLKMLPLAPLGAVALVVVIEVLLSASRVRGRVLKYIDAPVLGELPPLSRLHCSQWQMRKAKGSSSRKGTVSK